MSQTSVPRIAVLISGRGTNLQALIEAAQGHRLGGTIVLVVSNRAGAAGLARARAAGIETLVLPHQEHPSREAHDAALVHALRLRGVTFLCLAGFMRLVSPILCDAFRGAIVNIHPSLLPSFPGPDAQRQALEHGVKISGATVHFVTPELDAGPIILQASVPVHDDDTVESLSARILDVEHQLYPRAVRGLLARGWRLEGRRVVADRGVDGAGARRRSVED